MSRSLGIASDYLHGAVIGPYAILAVPPLGTRSFSTAFSVYLPTSLLNVGRVLVRPLFMDLRWGGTSYTPMAVRKKSVYEINQTA